MAPRVMPFFLGPKIAQNSVKTAPQEKGHYPWHPVEILFLAKIAAREPFLGRLGPRGQTNFWECGRECFVAYRMWSTKWAKQKKIALGVCSHRQSGKIGAQWCAKRPENKDF